MCTWKCTCETHAFLRLALWLELSLAVRSSKLVNRASCRWNVLTLKWNQPLNGLTFEKDTIHWPKHCAKLAREIISDSFNEFSNGQNKKGFQGKIENSPSDLFFFLLLRKNRFLIGILIWSLPICSGKQTCVDRCEQMIAGCRLDFPVD